MTLVAISCLISDWKSANACIITLASGYVKAGGCADRVRAEEELCCYPLERVFSRILSFFPSTASNSPIKASNSFLGSSAIAVIRKTARQLSCNDRTWKGSTRAQSARAVDIVIEKGGASGSDVLEWDGCH